VKIGQHRKKHLNKLISFEGIIRRKSGVNPMLKSIEYLCSNPSCPFSEHKIKIKQVDEKIKRLKVCPKCKSGVEEISKNLIDCLLLVLEQDFSERNDDCDSQKVHIKIMGNLTNNDIYRKLKISSRVKIIGILHEVNKNTNGGAESVNYNYILEANNIIFLEDSNDINLTIEDKKEFIEFAKNPDCFKILTSCYIPDIYGHRKIKEQLILQHIGSSFENCRNDSHILLLGDPSTGKTKLIKESLKYNTRYVYSSGSSATKAGLTATVIKDELIGTWVLEPGVLPRANGGIAGCDELDKLNKEDTNSLTEALEQQVISFNKANISAELKTQCPFLAGANPKYGKFENEIEIQKQVNFDPVLISRFDLIFIIKDTSNREKDYNVISHLLNQYEDNVQSELLEKYDKTFIKKYLHYCKNIKPKLTQSTKEKLANYFASVRANENKNNVFGFTIRQMEGVVRLACAYAKFHQSKTINLEHITYAFDVFNDCLKALNQRQDILICKNG